MTADRLGRYWSLCGSSLMAEGPPKEQKPVTCKRCIAKMIRECERNRRRV